MKKDPGKNDLKEMLPVLILVLVGLFFAWPLLGSRFIPTHDGEYHIIRFMEFFRMLSQGYLFPRWAPTLNSGYGLPLFNFQYPLPNYIGSVIHLFGFDFVQSFRLVLASGYIASALASYFWLRTLFTGKAALFGSVVSLLAPYWFVDIYIRGSVGEVWSFVFVFLSLFFIENRRSFLLALAVAGLILSHNIMAMVFLPPLLVVYLLRMRCFPWPFGLGLSLSAFFWVPAILEKKYMTGLSPVDYRDHFARLYELLIPGWGTEYSATGSFGNKISFQIGILPILLMTVMFILSIFRKIRGRDVYAVIGLWFFSIFMMLPASGFIWSIFPFLSYIQYPWRLLSVGIPVVAYLAAFLGNQVKSPAFLIPIIITGFALIYPYTRPVSYESRDDTYYQSRVNFTDGTNSMGNAFSTVWTPWIDKRAVKFLAVDEETSVETVSEKYLRKEFSVRSPAGENITAALTYFPGWMVSVNGQEVPIDLSDGLINFPVPAGTNNVLIYYRGTAVQKISETVSLSALVIVLMQAIIKGIYAYRHRRIAA